MDIVFNINYVGLEGLGATLSSLLRHCSQPQRLTLWFFCNNIAQEHHANIRKLLEAERFNGAMHFIDFNAEELFGRLPGLHGDWTTYGRLLIEDYVHADTALYLDADLLVMVDVLELCAFEFDGKILGAVNGGTVGSALDRPLFLEKLGSTPDTRYFNCGVVYFNLKQWRAGNVKQRWKEITEKYRDLLLSHDQTIMNALCKGDFAHLPPNFNCAWYPSDARPSGSVQMIIHFVGSPKPWDFLGSILHNGYKEWHAFNTPYWAKAYGQLSIDKIKRAWKIKNSIMIQTKRRLSRR